MEFIYIFIGIVIIFWLSAILENKDNQRKCLRHEWEYRVTNNWKPKRFLEASDINKICIKCGKLYNEL